MATKLKSTWEQRQIGRLLGIENLNRQSELDKINKFANAYGVTKLNSQEEVALLTPLVAGWLNPNQSAQPAAQAVENPPPVAQEVRNPDGSTPLPAEAALGTSTPSDLSNLLMQQQSDLKAQNDAFMAQQQQFSLQQQQQYDQLKAQQGQFALQQQQQYDQVKAQIEAQARAAAAVAPGAVAGTTPKTPGWTENKGGITTLESLLLGTQAVTGALQKMVVA
jgi:hypothetical protein